MTMEKQNINLIEILEKKDYNLFFNILNQYKFTPNYLSEILRQTSYLENFEVNKALIKAGANKNVNCEEPLINSIAVGNIELVKYLLQLGVNCNELDSIYLGGIVGHAASSGHLELVKLFISMGHTYRSDDDAAFRYSVIHEHLDIADYLLGLGKMNLLSENEYILERLVKDNKPETLKWFFVLAKNQNTQFKRLNFMIAFSPIKDSKEEICEVYNILKDAGANLTSDILLEEALKNELFLQAKLIQKDFPNIIVNDKKKLDIYIHFENNNYNYDTFENIFDILPISHDFAIEKQEQIPKTLSFLQILILKNNKDNLINIKKQIKV